MSSLRRNICSVNLCARLALWGCVSCAPSAAVAPSSSLGSASWVCAPSGPEMCSDARDNNCNGLADEGCGVSSGLVQFMIAWEDDADLDIEVTDPDGGPARIGAVSNAGLIKDRDCPGRDERHCRGVNVETVALAPNRQPKSGKYRVVVRLAPRQELTEPVAANLSARLGPLVRSESVLLSMDQPQRVFVWEM